MRRRFIQQPDGSLLEVAKDDQPVSEGTMVMGDIQPYQAMFVDQATGVAPMVTSRSQHRELLRRNGLIEVGNEVEAHLKQRERKELPRDPRLKQRLIEVSAEKLRYN